MEQKTQFIFEIEPADSTQIYQPLELTNDENDPPHEKELKVRLDKWLWAARFFKTRALARSAIENGKVFYDGQKTIPSKEIAVGATLLINQGKNRKIIIIKQLSTRRRSTDEANALFEEISSHVFTSDAPQADPMAPDDKKPRKIARFLRRALTLSGQDNSRE
ncbi:MAG TPA: S4 domain-containing protein [Gammaproteobacteria bacterium]|nr:S4 domain-containing protein [Gammaproteobacteria bacterium]